MNKLLTLFGFLFFTASAFAQISVTVSGNIEDLDGNPTANHDVNIIVDSTFADFVYYNTVQTNADGDYSDTFEVPDELTQGAVTVWINDCNNTFTAQTSFWSPGGNPVIDFVYCSNNCSLSISDNGQGVLETTAAGEAPFTYEWDDLSTLSTLTVNTTNYYCVTMTDAIGCTSNACYYYEASVIDMCDDEVFIYQSDDYLFANINVIGDVAYAWSTGETSVGITATTQGEYCVTVTYGEDCFSFDCMYVWGDTTVTDSCYVSIEVVQGGAWLQATGSGVAPYSYAWSTGESGNAIEIQGDTLYCVTIVDAENCTAYACHGEYTAPLRVQGYAIVNSPDSASIEATFNLYSIDGDELELIATQDATVYYAFNDLEEGDYIVQAIADGYVPTYHFSSLWWDEADVITASTDYTLFNIALIPLEELIAGPGGITGTVTGPDEFGGGETGGRNSEPIAGAGIILFDSNNAPIAYMFTDAEGNYAFTGLAYGTYTVYIELPGYDQVFYTVTIGSDNELVENINFTVDETIITATKAPLLQNNFLSIYPNPVKGELNMNLNLDRKGRAMVQVINVTGQIVFNDSFAQYQQQKAIDVSSLKAGFYLVKVTTEEGIIVQQFIKQ